MEAAMILRPIRLTTLILATLIAMPVAVGAAETEKREAVIAVSGEADSSVAPDMAVVTLGVVRLEKTARAALDGNSQAMSAVLKGLKDEGIADKDLQTSDFSIQPQYVYPDNSNGEQKAPVLTGYQVSNTLTVRIRDLKKLGVILDRTVTLGVNQGGDIRFTNDNPEKTIDEARKRAVRNAFAKARTLADAAGVKLGRVIEISEASSQPEAQPLARMAMAKQADTAVPVAAGENTYTVNVSITFAIEQ
jgi:hypothetical protein